MTDLRAQLRTLVDAAAEPVGVDEVVGRPVLVRLTPARASRRSLGAALAGAAVIALAVVGGAAVATSDAPAGDGTSAATTAMTAAVDPSSCYPEPCRAVDDARASALLGTPVALPSGLPEGWELVSSEVAFYPAGVEINGRTEPRRRRAAAAVLDATGREPQRGLPQLHLPAGHPRPPRAIRPPEPTHVPHLARRHARLRQCGPRRLWQPRRRTSPLGALRWTHAGIDYQLSSFGAPAEALRSVATSLP